jgi:hypothetical protein
MDLFYSVLTKSHPKNNLKYHKKFQKQMVSKRIYQDGSVAESKDLLGQHLRGNKMVGGLAKEHSTPTGLRAGFSFRLGHSLSCGPY